MSIKAVSPLEWKCPFCGKLTSSGSCDIGCADGKVIGWLRCPEGHDFYVESLDQHEEDSFFNKGTGA